MKAFIHDGISRHSDVDVKVADAVTSSISEITRIAAPDAPYNDEQMRVHHTTIHTTCYKTSISYILFLNHFSLHRMHSVV